MSDIDKLQEYAAKIMSQLEEAHFTAMNIQGRDPLIEDIADGFEIIRSELEKIDILISKATILAISLSAK